MKATTKSFIEALIQKTEETFNDVRVLKDSDKSYRSVANLSSADLHQKFTR